jgi:hypothetical protein
VANEAFAMLNTPFNDQTTQSRGSPEDDKSGRKYDIVLKDDETLTSTAGLLTQSPAPIAAVTIGLQAVGGKNVTLTLGGLANFTINTNVNLVLSGNLTIKGSGQKNDAMFSLNGQSARLTMNQGVLLTGNVGSQAGCVQVNGVAGYPAIFTMNGGAITGNYNYGTGSGVGTGDGTGGGINLISYGQFIMNGGAIYDNNAKFGKQINVHGEAIGSIVGAQGACAAFWGEGVTGSINRTFTGDYGLGYSAADGAPYNTIYAEPGGTASSTYTAGSVTVFPASVPAGTTFGKADMKDAGGEDNGSSVTWSSGPYGINEALYASR